MNSKRWNTISKITSHCSVTQSFSIICGLLFRCLLHYFCGRVNLAKTSILFSFPSPNPFVPFRDKSSVKYFITRIRDVSCDHTLHHQVDSAELFKTTQVRICSDTITISIAMLVQRLVRSWVKVYFEHRMFCCTTSCTPFGPNGVARTRVRTFGNRCYAVDVAVVVGAELCFDHTN